jgi:hypothetical protein
MEVENHKGHLQLQRDQEARALTTAQRAADREKVTDKRAASEVMDKNEEQHIKKLKESVFRKEDDKGNNVPDDDATSDYLAHARHTIAAIGETRPGFFNKDAGRPNGIADLDKSDQEFMLNRYKAMKRITSAQSGWKPGYMDKAKSLNLEDFDGVEDGDYISFPKLPGKPRIQKKDLAYDEGPVGIFDRAGSKTPNDALLRNILRK